ncbi:MAG: lyase [Chloroflexi bacterium]|nr:MAG: lyase [Chloroflexota bacterium]
MIAALAAAVLLAACGDATRVYTPLATSSATAAAPDIAGTSPSPGATPSSAEFVLQEFPVTRGQGPHDVAPAADGGVWYTAQLSGELGWLDPRTGQTRAVKLGPGSAPHGVIVGPDGAPWITDGGQNAIVRVDPKTNEVKRFPLPQTFAAVSLNTAAFDRDGILWFTGQAGSYGRLDPRTGELRMFGAPRGAGPYGITSCPDGNVYFASLAGSYVGRIDRASGAATVLQPPTPNQGARRVWCDSRSRVWVAEWNVGQLGLYDPASGWKEWKLPGARPMAYAVFVDDADIVWVTEWTASAIVRFDPATETFSSRPLSSPNANVRQVLGRPGEMWGAESGIDKLVVARPR